MLINLQKLDGLGCIIPLDRFLSLKLFCFLLRRLNQCLFTQDYETDGKFTIEDKQVSHLLPACHQDVIVRVYSKNPQLVCERILILFIS